MAKKLRPWLAYSVSKGRVYCVPCLLFGEKSSFAKGGFNDWKNARHRITLHENSNGHHDCSTQFLFLNPGRIDANITLLHEQEISYWRNVLKRVVAVIKALASRGLPFRGDNEKFGSQHNGNYMMLLELIAQFDPFLAEHITRFGNKGHKAENLENAILSTHESLIRDSININDCRGQAYDTAANMSGPYTGLQARIKEINKYADYTPCAAHSLNLVGKHAAESCPMAVTYFATIQNVYNFFSASTHRWEILTKHYANSESGRIVTVKSLSGTSWSAQDDAVHALEHHFPAESHPSFGSTSDETKETVLNLVGKHLETSTR
ncbi:unnamed protein product [Brassicogethes aeneus]|uniref:DUF4371 domain-containing protein n=1 Tax=Brassicogethes aeneus TaxID=1431903 RepID=A0A9P0ASD6_BRAAE|nr:unnamed protein product [Brassicogethes aeneus]